MTDFFLSFCSYLPLKLNHYLGAFIGRLLYLLNTDAKKVTLQNIAICFSELSNNEKRSLVKKSLIETGKNLTESSLIWNQSFTENAKHIRNIHGENYLDTDKNTTYIFNHFHKSIIPLLVIRFFLEIKFQYYLYGYLSYKIGSI